MLVVSETDSLSEDDVKGREVSTEQGLKKMESTSHVEGQEGSRCREGQGCSLRRAGIRN